MLIKIKANLDCRVRRAFPWQQSLECLREWETMKAVTMNSTRIVIVDDDDDDDIFCMYQTKLRGQVASLQSTKGCPVYSVICPMLTRDILLYTQTALELFGTTE